MSTTIGLVGCGRWGANILRDLRALGVTVIVADRDPQHRAYAREAGAVRVVVDVDAMPECGGYVVATPASAHRTVCEHLLERGAPVYVEKPPCTTLDDVAALHARAHGRLFVMHKWRYHPGVVALRDLLAGGELGSAVRLETVRTGPEPLPPDVDVTWHLVVHDLAIALEVLGRVPVVRAAEGELADDRLVWCRATLAATTRVDHVLEVGTGDRRRCVRLVGSEGVAVLADPGAPAVTVVDRHGDERAIALVRDLPLERELAAFVAHCEGGPPPKSTSAEALAVCTQLAAIDARVRVPA